MRVKKIVQLFFCFFFFLGVAQSYAQPGRTKAQLERQKKEKIKRINETNKILSETYQEKQASLGQLAAIKEQISSRQQWIGYTQSEIQLLQADIRETESIIDALQTDLASLKKEYGEMIYMAYKTRNPYDKLSFIFSASNFNEFARRMRYLQQYSQSRQNQAQQIEKVKATLTKQKQSIFTKQKEKSVLLGSIVKESENLAYLKTQKDKIVEKLNLQAIDLQKDLEDAQKGVEDLDRAIVAMVENEIRKSNAERTERKEENKIKLTPEAKGISKAFADNKSKLIWPVEAGFIAHKFGKQEHPVLKGVYIENLGVGIQTNKGEKVRSVHEGKVSAILSLPGQNGKAVMVQHGEYFTVYSNLMHVNVQNGQKIVLKQVIGEVATDKNGIAELQFSVWKNKDKLDPEDWLYQK